MASPPKSKLSRIARLGGLSSRVSGSYLGQRIKGAFQDEDTRRSALKKLHLENAERVVATMGNLKGAAMKVGQGIAQAVEGMNLPPEMVKVLSQLNDKAEPIEFSLIRSAVEHELEGALEDLFTDFDEEPLGTASLAQAHAARLPTGERVVVKVLHEGIEDSVDSDLSALRTMLVAGRVIRRDKEEIDQIFAEIRARLDEELDYFQEAANLEFFRRALAGTPGVVVPGTHPRYCTGRVLTMDRVTGAPLDDFLESASAEAKQRAGDTLIRVFHDMVYRLRAVHADPHPGTYLFQRDGTVGLLDFGCVKRFDVYWMGRYAGMARGCVLEDRASFVANARELDILRSKAAEDEELLWSLARLICTPLLVDHYACGGPDDDVLPAVKQLVPRVIARPDIRGPGDLVFLHRSLGGTYNMLRRLEHSYDYQDVFLRHTRHAVDVAAGRKEDGAPVGASR
jgi:predicted unusual protein kinase regulating ubiquinone biosynthesis (AarF/ABC1/UbiB family)